MTVPDPPKGFVERATMPARSSDDLRPWVAEVEYPVQFTHEDRFTMMLCSDGVIRWRPSDD